jgi:hypothetical protein
VDKVAGPPAATGVASVTSKNFDHDFAFLYQKHHYTQTSLAPNMAFLSGGSPANSSRGAMTLDSIAYAIFQNMRASLDLKAHVEDLIAGRATAPTQLSGLPLATLKHNILESLTRAHTANIVTHNLLLEAIENDRENGRLDITLDVRAMLKGATEGLNGARSLQEDVLVSNNMATAFGHTKLTSTMQKLHVTQERGVAVGQNEHEERIPTSVMHSSQPPVMSFTPAANDSAATSPSYTHVGAGVDFATASSRLPSKPNTPAQPQRIKPGDTSVPLIDQLFNGTKTQRNTGTNSDFQSTSNAPLPTDPKAKNSTTGTALFPNARTQANNNQVQQKSRKRVAKEQAAERRQRKKEARVKQEERNVGNTAASGQASQSTEPPVQPSISTVQPTMGNPTARTPKRNLPVEDENVQTESGQNKRIKQDQTIPKRKSDVSMRDASDDDDDISIHGNATKRTKSAAEQSVEPTYQEIEEYVQEYEDITEDVDARMKATSVRREKQKKKDMGLLGSEKRKRQSGASVGDSSGVNVRDGTGHTPSKRPNKKVKKDHEQAPAHPVEQVTPKSNENSAKKSNITPKQAPKQDKDTPKKGSGTAEKRSADEVDEFDGSERREKKKKKKHVSTTNLDHA